MQIPNAAVIGIAGPLRYVFITDLLLNCCSDDEVEAILAHEAGHIKGHHFVYYLLLIAAFAMSLPAAVGIFPLFEGAFFESLHPVTEMAFLPASSIVLLYAVFYWGFLFGFISRRFEREADVFSLNHSSDTTAFKSALGRLAALSGRSPSASGWRHFSLDKRIEFLQEATDDKEKKLRAARSARRLKMLVVLITLVSGGALALG